jgi:hypothetical protein
MADFEGRRCEASEGRSRARDRNFPFKVSRRCLSTALCWCRFSAVFTRLRGLDFGLAGAVVLLLLAVGRGGRIVSFGEW